MNMRVYISVDMEGIAGVVHEDQTNPVDPRCRGEYDRFRRLMTAEANAAIEGALEAGAETVAVNDSHWNMRNLLAEELHEAAELIAGDPKPASMMEGLDDSFQAACFIGYHAMGGTARAVLDHTYTDKVFAVTLNGRPVGELGINAAYAGTMGVPVVMVSGDAAACAEAKALLPDVVTVAVKEAVSRQAARSLAPAVACRRIRAAAADAFRAGGRPFVVEAPVTLEVTFTSTVHADMAELVPGSSRTGARSMRVTHSEYHEIFRAWRAMYNLAALG